MSMVPDFGLPSEMNASLPAAVPPSQELPPHIERGDLLVGAIAGVVEISDELNTAIPPLVTGRGLLSELRSHAPVMDSLSALIIASLDNRVNQQADEALTAFRYRRMVRILHDLHDPQGSEAPVADEETDEAAAVAAERIAEETRRWATTNRVAEIALSQVLTSAYRPPTRGILPSRMSHGQLATAPPKDFLDASTPYEPPMTPRLSTEERNAQWSATVSDLSDARMSNDDFVGRHF